ncbi:YbaY family lipoprotein [Cellulomonas soli]|uniref:YbaY family lipoprotein n=1 Tax=Cellulomonas soli TaxID=931535 RepID=UPI003F843E1C
MGLTGTWRFVSIDDLDPVTAVHGRPWLTFDGDGQVYGCSGVNRVRGTWTLEEPSEGGSPRLLIGPMVSTLMAGPPAATACELAVQQLLAVPLAVRQRDEPAGSAGGGAPASDLELVADDGRRARLVLDPHAGDDPAPAPAADTEQPTGAPRHAELPTHLDADGPLVVTGAVTYRQRIALPPRSVVTVTVEDSSRADAPARALGRSVIDAQHHQVPVPFEVVVDRSELDPHTRLALRARIDGPEGLLWVSDTHIPVPLDGSAEPFTVPLVHVAGRQG